MRIARRFAILAPHALGCLRSHAAPMFPVRPDRTGQARGEQVFDHPFVIAAFRRHPFQGLARHLQQGGAEKPGDPVIPAGALQPGGQEILQGTAA